MLRAAGLLFLQIPGTPASLIKGIDRYVGLFFMLTMPHVYQGSSSALGIYIVYS